MVQWFLHLTLCKVMSRLWILLLTPDSSILFAIKSNLSVYPGSRYVPISLLSHVTVYIVSFSFHVILGLFQLHFLPAVLIYDHFRSTVTEWMLQCDRLMEESFIKAVFYGGFFIAHHSMSFVHLISVNVPFFVSIMYRMYDLMVLTMCHKWWLINLWCIQNIIVWYANCCLRLCVSSFLKVVNGRMLIYACKAGEGVHSMSVEKRVTSE